ncbi:WD40-repeat-containing domain protein [Coprinopsis sp. MPI-PUGE-AT-0042]|nr:WD40-repeat-containing domain protein [Coprinopsis sp. MPI-PUGE-AT-0042]
MLSLPFHKFMPSRAQTYHFQQRLVGHTAQITRLVFSFDGELLATGSADQAVKIWDTSSFQCLHTLVQKELGWGQVTALKWFEDVKYKRVLAIGTGRGYVIFYHATSNAMLHIYSEVVFHLGNHWVTELSPGHIVRNVRFDDSNEVSAYILNTGKCAVLHRQTGTIKSESRFATAAGDIAFSPCLKYMLVDTLLTGFDLYTTHPFEKTRSYKISPNRHLNKTKVGTFVEEGSGVACPNYLQNTIQVFKRNSPNIIDKLRQDQVRVVASYSYPSHHIICSGGKANGDVYVWKKKIEQSRTESPPTGDTFQMIINFVAIVSFFWMTSGYWAIPITNALDVLASVARTTLVEPNHIHQEQLSAFPDMQPNPSTEFRADNQRVTTTIPGPVTTTSTYTTIIFQTVSVLPGTTSSANAAPQPHAHLGASSQEPQVLASETNQISYPEASHLFDTFAIVD